MRENQRHKGSRTVSPNLGVFNVNPQALERDISTPRQKRWDEGTIIWGDEDDALPLRILQAVESSPTTTSCLDVVTDFICGSGFSDPGLMDFVIDKEGTTLGEHHRTLSEYMAKLEGFSVNFKFDASGKIVYAYNLPIEYNRFVKPQNDKDKTIRLIKYNPYFGTAEFKKEYSTQYHVWNPKEVLNEYAQEGNGYLGQVYFQGTTRALYKFYPVPKYWTGQYWIYVDGQIQKFHAKNLDNGFFQSVLMSLIGDPNKPSRNPKHMKEVTGSDGLKRKENDGTTIGMEFNRDMASKFSGVDKTGNVFSYWSINKDEAPQISAFPSNSNFDVLSGTFQDAIRGITIATKTVAVLANLPQQASSLGSDGESMTKGIELMQSRAVRPQQILTNYYNNILLKNFANAPKQQVKILNFKPVSTSVTIEDKFWEVLSPEEKRVFVKDNVANVNLIETPPPTQVDGQPIPGQEPVSDALKNLNLTQLSRVQKIVARFNLSKYDPSNKNSLTYEQAKQIIKSYGFTEEQIGSWLVTEEELNEDV